MVVAIYPGSFDPPTIGHKYIVDTIAKLFDEVVVVVATNPEKRERYTFSPNERKEIWEEISKEYGNVKIDILPEDKYLAHYIKEKVNNDAVIIRGLRDDRDFSEEYNIKEFNRKESGVETIFIIPPKELSEVSSSYVKGFVGYEGWEDVIENYLPKASFKKMVEKYRKTKEKWNKLWEEINAKGDPGKYYNVLLKHYWEPHRKYHNLVHIGQCLDEFEKEEEQAGLAKVPEAVEFAIWFHDIIYNPRSKTNEEDSAKVAKKICKEIGVSREFTEKVSELILYTKHQETPPEDNIDARLIMDVDLAKLGSSPSVFDNYTRKIREEYSHMTEKEFAMMIKRSVTKLLSRDSIYLTDYFKEKYEKQARRNLERSKSLFLGYFKI